MRGATGPLRPSYVPGPNVGSGDTVLVLYDSTGTYGYYGDLYAVQLANLLSHFNVSTYLEPVESYTSGQMTTFSQTFYLGVLYGNPLPAAFQSDALTTTHPLVWCGNNLWNIAWNADWSADNAAFTSQYGIEFAYMAAPNYPTITYKGCTLSQDPYSGGQGLVNILNPSIATTVATSVGTDGSQMPYVVHAGNLWYVGDNPMCDTSAWLYADRSLVFQDMIHDVIGDNAPTQHNAVIRIEDVDAWSTPSQLMAIADTLYAANVPFAICVIPEYVDPFGVWNYGTPVDEDISGAPEVVAAINYMVSKGGEVIMHGDTHQYDQVDNPYSGVSADDYEFFRMVENSTTGVVEPYGPVYEDSQSWAHGKIEHGFSVLNSIGFNPGGWNTPHYLASPIDYTEFASDFAFSMCRGKNFVTDDQCYLYWMEQATVYPVVDSFGMLRLPETLGYVTTPQFSGISNAMPSDMVSRAQNIKCVRDGWAGMFFHWFLDVSLLQELVTGIQADGFTFVSPTAAATAIRSTLAGK